MAEQPMKGYENSAGTEPDEEFMELIRQHGHVGVAQDEYRRRRVPEDNRCKRCDGSGNQLMFMYQKCEACGGDGVSRGNEHDFRD